MPKYSPTTIAYQESGLIRDRQAYVTPNDAFVQLDNAYVWRGITKRRLGYELLGRLRRNLTTFSYFDTGVSPWSFNLLTISGRVSNVDISGAPTLVVTTPVAHGLSNGDDVVFTGVGGTTQLNGNTYTIANVTATTFEVTQAGPGAYTSGGFWMSDRALADEPNADIECGSVVIVLDPGGGNEETLTDQGDGTMTSTGPATGTINYVTGAITITHTLGAGVATTVSYAYHPCLPCMGVTQRELNAINAEDTIFFDQKYAYQFSASTFDEFLPATGISWNSDNTQFFWWTNYWNVNQNKLFWVTNFNAGAGGDPIRYTDGTTWTSFLPALDGGATTFLQQALMLIPYRGRLVALNTFEGATLAAATQNPNRARWSQNGDPTDQTNGWRSDVQGRGGFVDAPTNEHIVSAGFIRDTLIVFFERSTWKLRYTGNEILPFVWERINIELGAESTFSIVRFDKGILAVGDKAIVTCDGNYVERIDQAIRDEVFKIHNGDDGVKRVHGVRNFFEQLVYWVFPSADEDPIYPNRVLIYNYDNQTWAFFRDSFTALGTFQRTSDVRWSDLAGFSWQEYMKAWNAGRQQSQFPLIVGGNQQGFIQIFNQKVGSDASLHITAIATGTPPTITSPDHNLVNGDIVEINGIVGTTSSLNGFRYRVVNVTQNTFQIQQKPRFTITAINTATNQVTATGNNLNAGDLVQFENVGGTVELNGRTGTVLVGGNTFTVDIDMSGMTAFTAGGTAENCNGIFNDVVVAGGSTYLGCGEIRVVSNFVIRSKKFNMLNQGRKTQLGYMDFLVDVTSNGQISVPLYVDYNESQRVNPRSGDSFFNWGINTKPQDNSTENQEKEWHRFYCPVEAQFIQYELTLDESQMISKEIQESGFNLNAAIMWHEKGARLVQ